MKHLLLIIFILLSISCISQNRFTDEYFCDTCFLNTGIKQSDSIKFNQVIKEIESDTTNITLTTEDCLLIYFNGYINGSINYTKNSKFNYYDLLREIKANKRSIINQYKFNERNK